MIRFEIKPQVIEYVRDEIGLDEFEEADAVLFIEQLMALMLVHKCISVTPDAALVEALRPFAALWQPAMADKPDNYPVWQLNEALVEVAAVRDRDTVRFDGLEFVR